MSFLLETDIGQMLFLYEHSSLSCNEIAELFNCSHTLPSWYARRYKIETRTERWCSFKIDYDNSRYLGSLCYRNHEFENTGKSLRYKNSSGCILCQNERSKTTYQTNKQKITKQHRSYEKKRYKEDVADRLHRSVSVAIRADLGSKKAGHSWENLVGYDTKTLMNHVELRFKKGMTWKNRGLCWELDHIIPRNLFDFQTVTAFEFKLCWGLENLRPLEIGENRRRSRDGSDLTLGILEKYDLLGSKYALFLLQKGLINEM